MVGQQEGMCGWNLHHSLPPHSKNQREVLASRAEGRLSNSVSHCPVPTCWLFTSGAFLAYWFCFPRAEVSSSNINCSSPLAESLLLSLLKGLSHVSADPVQSVSAWHPLELFMWDLRVSFTEKCLEEGCWFWGRLCWVLRQLHVRNSSTQRTWPGWRGWRETPSDTRLLLWGLTFPCRIQPRWSTKVWAILFARAGWPEVFPWFPVSGAGFQCKHGQCGAAWDLWCLRFCEALAVLGNFRAVANEAWRTVGVGLEHGRLYAALTY